MTDQSRQGLATKELQCELRDLLSLAVLGDQVRWVLAGDEAAVFASWLARATTQWRAWADQVATHLVALGIAPDGRVRSVSRDIEKYGFWVPDGWLLPAEAGRLVVERLGILAGWARYRLSQAINPDTVRLLETVCSGLETHAREVREITRGNLTPDTPRQPRSLAGAR